MKFYGSAIIVAALLALASHKANAGMDTLLASASRTATTTASDINRTTEKAATFVLNVTAVPGVQTLTMTVQGKDNLGNYYTILSSTASAATGIVTLVVGLGISAAANASIGVMLPDIYRVVITHSGGSAFTYTLTRNTAQ